VTPAVGLAAVVGTAEGDGVVGIFFLGAIIDLFGLFPFRGGLCCVSSARGTQWLVVEVEADHSLTYASSSWLLPKVPVALQALEVDGLCVREPRQPER